ncbi:hypothetical protein GCM10009780_00370 [Actinomadura alba]
MTAASQVLRRPLSRALTLVPSVVALGTLFVVPPDPVVVKNDLFITAQTTGILDIEAGECFTDPSYSASAGEKIVLYKPCAERADNQSYGFVHAADGAWNRTELAAFAWKNCERGFSHYWSGAAGSGLDFYPIMPTSETWADGDRDIMCVVYRPKGKLPGSALPLR